MVIIESASTLTSALIHANLIHPRQFEACAEEIVKALELECVAVVDAVEAFTTSVVSFTNATGAIWPFVSLPDFERRGQSFNLLTHATHVGILPLVTVRTRAAYEEFATTHQEWVRDGLALQGDNDKVSILANISDHIFQIQGSDDSKVTQDESALKPLVHYGPGDFLPVWQQAPAPSSTQMINYDIFQVGLLRRTYRIMWETQRSVLSEVTTVDIFADTANASELADPSAVLLHPIYPYFIDNGKHDENEVVAVLVSVLPWRREFENVLREGKSGCTCTRHCLRGALTQSPLLISSHFFLCRSGRHPSCCKELVRG
jgi:hypothetical protein